MFRDSTSDPVRKALRPLSAGSRAETDVSVFRVHGEVSALVGRELELDQLLSALKRAIDYKAPQIITLVGNQGVGKSRLLAEFAMCVTAPTRLFQGNASSRQSRYSAIARLLGHRLGVADGEESDSIRAKLRDAAQAAFGDRRVGDIVHFLGGFLGQHYAESPFSSAFDDSPRQHDEVARTVLRRFFEFDASQSPLVLVLDDLHLADDETLSLLEELADGLAGSPVVMVLGARPELLVRRPGWGTASSAEHVRVDMRNLDSVQSAALFKGLLSRCGEIPEDLVEDAVEMTGGNPYFLEQLVRVFVAQGTIDTKTTPWSIDVDRALDTELPMTVEEAIQTRIAALEPDERDLLEKGAVFGNVFWVGAVVALLRTETVSFQEHTASGVQATWRDDGLRLTVSERVESLVARDYLLLMPVADSSVTGDLEVVFKHNLERELVAKMIPDERRKRYHRLAAQWLESRLSEWTEEQFEFLAQLYEGGGDEGRAAQAFIAGGDRARARYSNERAIGFYERALGLLRPDDGITRLDVLHNLGDVLSRVGRGDDAAKRFQEMMQIAWLFDYRSKGGAAHLRVGRLFRDRAEYDRALEHCRVAYQLFQLENDRRGLAGALDDIGRIYWLRGDYPKALEHHRQALGLRRAFGDQRSIAHSLANIGRVHHDSGSFKAAVEQFREALDIRREIGDRQGVMMSLSDLGAVHAADGNLDSAREMLSEALRIGQEIGDRMAQAELLGRLGSIDLRQGKHETAQKTVQQGIDLATSLGHRLSMASGERRLAEILLARGDDAAAREHASRALELAQKVGSQVLVGIAHRVLGEILSDGAATPDERNAAEQSFLRSIEILDTVRNELELAQCYRTFADFRDRTGNAADAAKLRAKADKVFSRLRGAAAG